MRSRRTSTGWSASATSTATGSSPSSCPTSRGSTTARSTTPSTAPYAHYKPGYFRLVARYGRLGWSAHEIAAVHDEHVEDVWVNVAYALSLRAMARLAGDDAYARRADGVEAALLERCLDPATGLFYDLAGRAERPVRVSTWSALSPLMLDTVPEEVRRRLVEEHLLDPRRYRAAFGIPSVAMDEPSFRPGFDLWRTWRGPSWMNVAWLLTPALRELGYDEDADRIAAGMSQAVARDGLREYYDPRTGAGLGGPGVLLVGARRRPRIGVTAGDLVDVARDDAALDAALAGDGQGGGVEGGGGEGLGHGASYDLC